MEIRFGREICSDLHIAEHREWLVTNGIGGYASGTVSGLVTRRYHGLLIAALNPPLARTLLLAKLDEAVEYEGALYLLGANRWVDGTLDPQGYRHIERFQLEGSIPRWTYACGDALLEKRIWMQSGENTTYIRYTLQRGRVPIKLSIKALVNYRDHHSATQARDWQMGLTELKRGSGRGVEVTAFSGAVPFYLFTEKGEMHLHHDWHRNVDLAMERSRGLGDRDDHLHAATFQTVLKPGETLTIVATTQPHPNLDGKIAILERLAYDQTLITQWESASNLSPDRVPGWVQQLVLAADQFVADRPLPEEPSGKTILAGYPWFGDWGRDTMISLPGLTLTTGKSAIARTILKTFARYLDQGMLPNTFPEGGEPPQYNTVDAILWYFEAIRSYHAVTKDDELLREIFAALAETIHWHCQGTRYGIKLDRDGLITAGEPGVQLTWMDAKVGDWVVTPRAGKPIEINALWYSALQSMVQFAQCLGQPYQIYEELAQKNLKGFQRFWNPAVDYCYDVLDGSNGNDVSLRPNQIFAVALPMVNGAAGHPSLLSIAQQKAVVDVCGSALLTSFGLRSLSPNHPDYQGQYGGDQYHRDRAYHQGTVWGWLLGPYIQAHLHIYRDPVQAATFLEPIADHLQAHGLGSISEIFDGAAPMTPQGCFAQAWSVAEILRAWSAISTYQTTG